MMHILTVIIRINSKCELIQKAALCRTSKIFKKDVGVLRLWNISCPKGENTSSWLTALFYYIIKVMVIATEIALNNNIMLKLKLEND